MAETHSLAAIVVATYPRSLAYQFSEWQRQQKGLCEACHYVRESTDEGCTQYGLQQYSSRFTRHPARARHPRKRREVIRLPAAGPPAIALLWLRCAAGGCHLH